MEELLTAWVGLKYRIENQPKEKHDVNVICKRCLEQESPYFPDWYAANFRYYFLLIVLEIKREDVLYVFLSFHLLF